MPHASSHMPRASALHHRVGRFPFTLPMLELWHTFCIGLLEPGSETELIIACQTEICSMLAPLGRRPDPGLGQATWKFFHDSERFFRHLRFHLLSKGRREKGIGYLHLMLTYPWLSYLLPLSLSLSFSWLSAIVLTRAHTHDQTTQIRIINHFYNIFHTNQDNKSTTKMSLGASQQPP